MLDQSNIRIIKIEEYPAFAGTKETKNIAEYEVSKKKLWVSPEKCLGLFRNKNMYRR